MRRNAISLVVLSCCLLFLLAFQNFHDSLEHFLVLRVEFCELLLEQSVSLSELLSQILNAFVFGLVLGSVTSDLVHTLENHPELSSVLESSDDFGSTEVLELLPKRRRVAISSQRSPTDHRLDHQANQSSALMFLETQVSLQIFTVLNASFARQEGSVQNDLKASSPSELKSFH